MYLGEKKYNKRVLFIQAQPYFIYVKVFDKYEIMILTDIDMFIDYVYIFLVKFFFNGDNYLWKVTYITHK